MGGCNTKEKDEKENVRNNHNSLRVHGMNKNKKDQKLEAKVVLIGNSGVGKTSIALRYKEGKYNDNPRATVGASYFQKLI
jgi:GTPase SAR1 family protein